MRRLWLVCAAAVVLGCSKKDNNAGADSTAMGAPATHPDIALADVAGKWNVQLATAESDSTILTYELNATADTAGWTITFPGREPIPVRITGVSGDSIMIDAGPYEAVLRPGVQVTTHSVVRLRGDRLMGTAEAHYASTGADSVAHFRTRGRKAQ